MVFAGRAVLYDEVTAWTSSVTLNCMCPLLSTSSVDASQRFAKMLWTRTLIGAFLQLGGRGSELPIRRDWLNKLWYI